MMINCSQLKATTHPERDFHRSDQHISLQIATAEALLALYLTDRASGMTEWQNESYRTLGRRERVHLESVVENDILGTFHRPNDDYLAAVTHILMGRWRNP